MKAFETRTHINAPAQTIWALLTDASRYPSWNPTVTAIDGRIALNEEIAVHATISPKRAFPAKVIALDEHARMVWSNSMPLGLFKGERVFTLTPSPDGGTDFFMREEFTGLLAPLIGMSIPDLQPSFEAFASALKTTAEAT